MFTDIYRLVYFFHIFCFAQVLRDDIVGAVDDEPRFYDLRPDEEDEVGTSVIWRTKRWNTCSTNSNGFSFKEGESGLETGHAAVNWREAMFSSDFFWNHPRLNARSCEGNALKLKCFGSFLYFVIDRSALRLCVGRILRETFDEEEHFCFGNHTIPWMHIHTCMWSRDAYGTKIKEGCKKQMRRQMLFILQWC